MNQYPSLQLKFTLSRPKFEIISTYQDKVKIEVSISAMHNVLDGIWFFLFSFLG